MCVRLSAVKLQFTTSPTRTRTRTRTRTVRYKHASLVIKYTVIYYAHRHRHERLSIAFSRDRRSFLICTCHGDGKDTFIVQPCIKESTTRTVSLTTNSIFFQRALRRYYPHPFQIKRNCIDIGIFNIASSTVVHTVPYTYTYIH